MTKPIPNIQAVQVEAINTFFFPHGVVDSVRTEVVYHRISQTDAAHTVGIERSELVAYNIETDADHAQFHCLIKPALFGSNVPLYCTFADSAREQFGWE